MGDGAGSLVVGSWFNRTALEYQRLNPDPSKFAQLAPTLVNLWHTEPSWNQSHFAPINQLKTWIAAADHDEGVYPENQSTMLKWMPDAGGYLMPQVSHFAVLQAEDLFADMVKEFLQEK